MFKLTSHRLRVYWFLLVGVIAVVFLLPDQDIQSNLLWGYFDRHWVHFLAYAAVSILPLLAWQRRPALVLSLGVAGLSAMLEIIHGIVTDKSASLEGIVVNLLGVIAGALLGLNILALRSRTRPRERTLADG
jgi:hypothetical protein